MKSGILTVDWSVVKRHLERSFEYQPISSRMSLSERFKAIRSNYRTYQLEVDEGFASWLDCDPYRIADWINLFTPIEADVWCDIRYHGLPMWPQFPVGRYFADFANPLARVALECDGAAFHDSAKDAARDRDFAQMGWRVIRIPGWRCSKIIDSPSELLEKGEDLPEDYENYWLQNTTAGIMRQLKDEFKDLREEEIA